MRYTTIIDISQAPEVYRNQNVRLVYLHLVLRAGYHDHDRDLVRISIRSLAAQVGLTVAAVRHALGVLEKWKLLQRTGSYYQVRKWVPEQTITIRAKTAKQQQQLDLAVQRRADEERREREAELERIRRENQAASGRTSWDDLADYKRRQAEAGDVSAQEWLRKNATKLEEREKRRVVNADQR